MDADLHLRELRRIGDLLEQLLARQRLEQVGLKPAASEMLALRQLFEVLGTSLGTTLFTVADLLAFAAQRPALATAIAAIAGPERSTKRVGKAFARAAGAPVGEFMLHRAGRERSGVIWRLERISATTKHV